MRSCNYLDRLCQSSSLRRSSSSYIEGCTIRRGRCKSGNTSRWICFTSAHFSKHQETSCWNTERELTCAASIPQRRPHLPRFDRQGQLRKRSASGSHAFGHHPRTARREHCSAAEPGRHREGDQEACLLGALSVRFMSVSQRIIVLTSGSL